MSEAVGLIPLRNAPSLIADSGVPRSMPVIWSFTERYSRLLTGYRCDRWRNKSHYQIVLELLGRLSPVGQVAEYLNWQSQKKCLVMQTDTSQIWRNDGTQRLDNPTRDIVAGPFFVDLSSDSVKSTFESSFRHKIPEIIKDADGICQHKFNLLGSGFHYWGHPIDWSLDPVSGYRWANTFEAPIERVRNSPSGTDIKIPWELSRMQHLPTLGKAYWLTGKELYALEVIDQIADWLDKNPCLYGVNWTFPMDAAIRIVNIIYAYVFIRKSPNITEQFSSRVSKSVEEHGRFIVHNLEFGVRSDGTILNGNHYLANVVGLLYLGLVCTSLSSADEWKTIGFAALEREMDRQVGDDGGDFESSISYHRLVLELFTVGAVLCRLNGIVLSKTFWTKLERMFDVVLFTTRPDGKAPQVGDSDDGRVQILSDYGSWDRTGYRYLLSLGAALFQRTDMKAHAGGFSEDGFWLLGPAAMDSFTALARDERELQSKGFPDSGLYVMRQGDSYLLACCGEVGTEGLGNHKHNDLLSFELYAGDKAFIVDPGSYVYTRDPESRNLFRSTRYHNTVVIDGQEQNRFDKNRIFEMNPDARVIVHEWLSTSDFDRLDVEHTGYARLNPPVSHRRTFLFKKREGVWEIADVLKGEGEHTADWYFHFDHGIELETRDGIFRTACVGTNLEIRMHSETQLDCNIEDGWMSRRYGHKLPAKIIHYSTTFNSECHIRFIMRTV